MGIRERPPRPQNGGVVATVDEALADRRSGHMVVLCGAGGNEAAEVVMVAECPRCGR